MCVPAGFLQGQGTGTDVRSLPSHLPMTPPKSPALPINDRSTLETKSERVRVTVRYLPHKAAHRISELNLFLYLRISGVSLCGLVLVGFTLTTEPFRVGSCLMASDLIPSQENPTETQDTGIILCLHGHWACSLPRYASSRYSSHNQLWA